MKHNKKGVMGLNMLPALVGAIVVGFIFLSIGAQVLDNVATSNVDGTCEATAGSGNAGANCSAAFNTSYAGLLGLVEFGDFGATIGLIGAAVVVLTLLTIGLGRLTGNL